jgi:hypothetical protein
MSYGIYIYFDGSDLHEIAEDFREEMKSLSERYHFLIFVDNLHPKEPDMEEDDLPDWDMGINFDLADPSEEELKELLSFFSGITDKYDHGFAVGYYEKKTGMNEDIGFLEKGKDFAGILGVLKQLNGRS